VNLERKRRIKSYLLRRRLKDIGNFPPISIKSFFNACFQKYDLKFYEKNIIEYFGSEYGFFTKNARLAIYLFLRAIGVKKGDEVILSAFNCMVVPEVIVFLGAKPVYVDVGADLNMDSEDVKSKVTEKTKCIILPYHDGIDVNHEKLLDLASSLGIKVLSDCAHLLHSKNDNKEYSIKNSHIDGLIYSFSHSKNFSLKCGGLLLVKRKDIAARIEEICHDICSSAKLLPEMNKVINLLIDRICGRYAIFDFLVKVFGRIALLEKEILQPEYDAEIPKVFFQVMSPYKTRLLYHNLFYLNDWNAKRKELAMTYKRCLKNKGIYHVIGDIQLSIPLHYPVLLPVLSDDIYYYLMKYNIYVERWFNPQLYPYVENKKRFLYDENKYPASREYSKRIINLPLSPRLSVQEVKDICYMIEDRLRTSAQ